MPSNDPRIQGPPTTGHAIQASPPPFRPPPLPDPPRADSIRRRGTYRPILITLFAHGVLGGLLLLVAACQKVYWVGSTDVEITFVVTNADTGQPIPGATVQVHSEGGFCEDQEVKDFRLTTDPEGVGARRCRECMSFGEAHPLLPYRDTFGIHLPLWEFGVSAPGYASSGKAWVGDYGPARRRKGDAALTIPVPLHRLPARQQGDPAPLRGDGAP